MDILTIKKIHTQLLKSDRILLAGHRGPDLDACGSVLALYIFLTGLGKEVGIFLPDLASDQYDFLPSFEAIDCDKKILERSWDTLLVLDSGSVDYAGLEGVALDNFCVINIDHHQTNVYFGDLNLVDQSVSSACEIIFNFFKAIGIYPDKKMATCLLAGILADTGGFSNAATSAKAIGAASDLVRYGAKIGQVVEAFFKNKSIHTLRLWGLVLSRLKIDKKKNAAYTHITERDLKDAMIDEDDLGGFSNFLNVIADVDFAILLRQIGDHTKVSFRTTKDSVDVAKMAEAFGGGGHQKSAGFTVDWDMDKVKKELGIA